MPQSPESDGQDAEATRRSATGDLAARIARAKREGPAAAAARSVRQNELTGMGRAFRFAAEFVGAIIVGGLLGFGLDSFLGTRPWAMMILLMVGFAAGVLNVIRAASSMNAPPEGRETAVVPPGDKTD